MWLPGLPCRRQLTDTLHSLLQKSHAGTNEGKFFGHRHGQALMTNGLVGKKLLRLLWYPTW